MRFDNCELIVVSSDALVLMSSPVSVTSADNSFPFTFRVPGTSPAIVVLIPDAQASILSQLSFKHCLILKVLAPSVSGSYLNSFRKSVIMLKCIPPKTQTR